METSQKSIQNNCQTSTCLSEDSLVRLFRSLGSELGLKTPEGFLSLMSLEYSRKKNQNLYYWKMSKDFYLHILH
jgi:hypothetical protein